MNKQIINQIFHHKIDEKLKINGNFISPSKNPIKNLKLKKTLRVFDTFGPKESPDKNLEYKYEPSKIIEILSKNIQLYRLTVSPDTYKILREKNIFSFNSLKDLKVLDAILYKFKMRASSFKGFLADISTKTHYGVPHLKFDTYMAWVQCIMRHWVLLGGLDEKPVKYCTIQLGNAEKLGLVELPQDTLEMLNEFKCSIKKKKIKSVVVNGNIGVGKTTVLKHAAKKTRCLVLLEPHIENEQDRCVGSLWANLDIFNFWSQYYNNYHAYSKICGLKHGKCNLKMKFLKDNYLGLPNHISKLNGMPAAIRIRPLSVSIYELVATLNYILHQFRISILPPKSKILIERDNYETMNIFSEFGLFQYAEQMVLGLRSAPYRPSLLSDLRWGLKPPNRSIWISCAHARMISNLKMRHKNGPIAGRQYELNTRWQKIMIIKYEKLKKKYIKNTKIYQIKNDCDILNFKKKFVILVNNIFNAPN